MLDFLARVHDDPTCACDPTFASDRLLLDASDCPGGGDLADEPACRATAVDALADREADAVVTRTDCLERAYEDGAAALLVAAGRFAERVAFYDDRLAARAGRDPLGAARAALGRAGPPGDIVAETGLAECARCADGYDGALRPFVGPTVAKARVAARPPPDAELADARELPTGATVRTYADDRALRTYHLEPVEHTFDGSALATLADAYALLADGAVGGERDAAGERTAGTGGHTGSAGGHTGTAGEHSAGTGEHTASAGERAPGRAVRQVADPDAPVEALADALRKHTRGYGVLADFFADPSVSDVFATAPVDRNPLRVTVDGERMRTNVRLTDSGAETLASRFRRESGRAFSRAAPTLDATAETGAVARAAGDGRPADDAGGTVRVAGVTDPASDGPGFAFRAHDATPWTLPALVANDTLPADAAALLSLSVERAAAGLVVGPRGAGKTTALGALCWELPAATRTVVIEDTPELPVAALQRHDRDVQPLRTATDDGPGLDPAEALRTALRLGEGALVVGEVRGEEAAVLYEAMRVGASGDAVLGTIHGDGAEAVRERVVSDLGVPASSFAATDLVITLEAVPTDAGTRRRVKAIEEVVSEDRIETLYEIRGAGRASDANGANDPESTGDAPGPTGDAPGPTGDAPGPTGHTPGPTGHTPGPTGHALEPTGRLDRGNSVLLASLARSDESYADARDALADREALLARLAREDRTTPGDVVATYADRREP